MAKQYETKEELRDNSFTLTNEECYALSERIKQCGSREKLLIEVQAMKVLSNGSMAVRMFDGLKGEDIPMFPRLKYWTEIPYDFWKRAIEQVDNYLNRVAYAQKLEDEKNQKIM